MEKTAELTGTIFKIRRFSVHDGPGIRTSVFLKGCPLSCVWCHSPEGIGQDITVWHDSSVCIACGQCVNVCKNNAVELKNDNGPHVSINRTQCTHNGDCINICPSGALQHTGFTATVSEIVEEIMKDKLYYETSGGGVTLTGGEPMFQPEFTIEILKECKRLNVHTAIETSLFCEKETVKRFLFLVDVFIVDMKIFDEKQHIRYTGVSNEIIKDNIRYLVGAGKDIIIRIPLIPGITDTEDNISSINRFIHDLNPAIVVEQLIYNPLAGNNWVRMGLSFSPGLPPCHPEGGCLQ